MFRNFFDKNMGLVEPVTIPTSEKRATKCVLVLHDIYGAIIFLHMACMVFVKVNKTNIFFCLINMKTMWLSWHSKGFLNMLDGTWLALVKFLKPVREKECLRIRCNNFSFLFNLSTNPTQKRKWNDIPFHFTLYICVLNSADRIFKKKIGGQIRNDSLSLPSLYKNF